MRPAAIAPVALLLAALLASPAQAVSVYAGAGPRWREGAVDAVGTTRVAVGLGALFDLTLDVQGYLGGPQDQGLAFAGATAGVLVSAPLPGPVGIETGINGGVLQRTEARHGVDGALPLVTWETAVRGSLGPARLRVSYTRALGGVGSSSVRDMGSQVMFMLGFGL